MEKKIAVIGAGGTGQTAAADLTLAGHHVRLYEQPQHGENLQPVLEKGGIEIKGAGREGFAKIHKVTTNIEEALEDVSVIIVAVVASRHESIAEVCAPHLRDGQTIVISPGNAGSLVFAEKLREKGVKGNVTLAEFEGNLYPCRIVGRAEVIVALPMPTKHVAAFPAKDTDKVVEALKGIYDVVPATNIIEAALNTPNVVIHLGASLLNIGPIDQSGGEYYLYKAGITPSVLRCVEAAHAEKAKLFQALGYADRSPIDHLKKVARLTEFPEFDIFRGLIGPTSAQHRYITEDASTGVILMVSLGEMIGVPMPLSRALVQLASAVNQTDYFSQGRTAENLGIAGLSVEALNKFLAEGTR